MKEITPREDPIQTARDATTGDQIEKALRALRDSKATVPTTKVEIPQQTPEKWIPPKN